MSRRLRLSELPAGSSGVIEEIRPGSATSRLREMGMLVGARVRIVRLAPLGDPIEIAVRGSLLSVRRVEAELIEVTTE
jgi:Fe2+ transport system protein FeoA